MDCLRGYPIWRGSIRGYESHFTTTRPLAKARDCRVQGTEIALRPPQSGGIEARTAEPPNATVYADTINMRVRLAVTSYLAIVPASIMRFPGARPGIKMLLVQLLTTRRQIAIFRLKNRTPSPLAQLFIECAREIAERFAANKEYDRPA